MSFNFDEVIDRVGTHSSKWDTMEANMVSRQKMVLRCGLRIWIFVLHKLFKTRWLGLKHGVHGYFGDDSEYRAALVSWMKRRHQWDVQPDWIVNATGLGNALSLCIRSFSKPGEGLSYFRPSTMRLRGLSTQQIGGL